MNVLFLFCSLPTLDTDSSLFCSLIHEFKRHGHTVIVSAKGRYISKTTLGYESGIPVVRISSHDFTGTNNNIRKAFSYIEYTVKQTFFTKKFFKNQKVDLIISHSLPPELGYIVSRLKKTFECPFYLIQTDFTWQDAVSFGFFKSNGPIGLYYRFWERKAFKMANYIGVPTKGNISFIKKYYPWIDDDQFMILPFWQKECCIKTNVNVKSKLGFDDKFLVIYGGSVGKAQRVDRIVQLAEQCRDYRDILFLILGRGANLSDIKQMVEDRHLSNVVFKDFMPQDQYLQLLSICDVGLIVLNEQLATPNFPSKSLSYFNLKIPVLAALDYVTDFGEYLISNQAGLWAYSDDIDKLKENLLKYHRSKEYRLEIAENAFRLYKENMTPERAYKSIVDFINKNDGIHN